MLLNKVSNPLRIKMIEVMSLCSGAFFDFDDFYHSSHVTIPLGY